MIRAEQESVKTLSDYWLALRRRKRYALSIGGGVALIAFIVALALPPVYRSSATILIEQQEIPEDLVRSTITSFADQRIQVISQRVMTRSNLQSIINKYNLYAEDRQSEPLETIIEQMRKDIEMKTISADVIDPRSGRPTAATIAFSLAYSSEHPATAQRVANELASLYLNENLKSRTQMATETATFMGGEVDKLSVTIADLEKKLAVFKAKNYERLPELGTLNMQLAQGAERDLEALEREVVLLNERKAYLEAQLAQLVPYTGMQTDTGETVLLPRDRLEVLKSQLASLTGLYTETHPQVLRLRREIAGLEAEVTREVAGPAQADVSAERGLEQRLAGLEAELSGLRQRYAGDHPDVLRLERDINVTRANLHKARKSRAAGVDEESAQVRNATNPAYIQLQTQLQSVDAELRAADERRERLRAQLSDYQQRLATAPQVEREYRELTRDHENAWVKYRELKAKQMEAQLAESLESERKGERFTLIEPPELPEKPVKPNRVAILFLGFVLAMAAGLGAAVARDAIDESVQGAKQLVTWFDLPPLVTVPYIITAEEQAAAARRRWLFLGGGMLAIIAAAVAVHVGFVPLDVLFYAGLRRLGLQ